MIERKEEGGGGGTCLYIQSDLDYRVNSEVRSNTIVEIQSITLTGQRESQQLKPIEVVLIYRPPKSNDRKALEEIFDFMGKIKDMDKKELIIMGDLNWDLLDKKGVGYKMVNELIEEFDLNSHITHATRITASQESLLDIMVSDIKNICDAGCINFAISDHFPVFLIKKRITPKMVKERIYSRS